MLFSDSALIKVYNCFFSLLTFFFTLTYWLKAQGSKLTACNSVITQNAFLRTRFLPEINGDSSRTPCAVRRASILVLLLTLFALIVPTNNAAAVVISWDPSPSPVAGYEFYYGTSSRNYEYVVDVGNHTSCSISGLEEGITYYFAAKAYSGTGLRSEFSEEILYMELSDSGVGSHTEIVLEAEDMAYHENGIQQGNDWLLWSNGKMHEQIQFPESGSYRFEVAARGDLARGVGPEMELLIDGVSKGTVFVNTTAHAIFEFEADISAGTHEIAIDFRNDYYDPRQDLDRNLYVDNIEMYLFVDDGASHDNEPSNIIAVEAENAILHTSMEIARDADASSEGFIWVPEGSGRSKDPDAESGYAVITFDVSSAGNYVIWGRTISQNGHNSFFISVDDGDYALWDTQVSTSWVWDKISHREGADPVHYYLKAGEHTLKIKQREDGTKIDKIIITRDMGFVPD